jgi:hypothetical protein
VSTDHRQHDSTGWANRTYCRFWYAPPVDQRRSATSPTCSIIDTDLPICTRRLCFRAMMRPSTTSSKGRSAIHGLRWAGSGARQMLDASRE